MRSFVLFVSLHAADTKYKTVRRGLTIPPLSGQDGRFTDDFCILSPDNLQVRKETGLSLACWNQLDDLFSCVLVVH